MSLYISPSPSVTISSLWGKRGSLGTNVVISRTENLTYGTISSLFDLDPFVIVLCQSVKSIFEWIIVIKIVGQ